MALIACAVPELVSVLRTAGHDVLVGSDPLIYLDQADLVVVDFRDGPVNGRDWVRHLVKQLDRIPLLVICATLEEMDEALAGGGADVLRRPLSAVVLENRASACLARTLEHSPSSTPGGAQDLLERLVTACPDPVIAADLRGNLLVFSRAAEAILGYEAREVLDGRLHVSELYAEPDDAARIMKAMKASEDRAAIGVHVRLRTRRGEAVPVHLSSSLVHDFAGRIVASVGIFRDERHSHELAMRLASATDQLVASEKRAATVAVAGATAHELNQPLTSVMGIVELLRLDKELPEKVQDRMERAYVQLDRMAEIVRNLSQVTGYGTKPYTDGQEILDLDKQ